MSEPWVQQGHHWVSPYNYDRRITEGFHFPDPVTIYDGTLRKLILTPGVRPTVDDMLRVAEGLESAGVCEVIMNISGWGDPTPNRTQYEVARAVLAHKFRFHVNLWGEYFMPRPMYRAIYDDPNIARNTLEMLAGLGADTVIVPLRYNQPGGGQDDAQRQAMWLEQIFASARSLGVSVSVDLIDLGRTPFEALVKDAQKYIDLGARHLGLLDSLGSLSPEATKLVVRSLHERLSKRVPMVLHVHDDFGMATANAIACASAGGYPDVAVNGLSYRSGHASFEQVVVSLEILYGVSTGIDLGSLKKLSDLVWEVSRVPRRMLQPVTGPLSFVRDSASGAVPVLRNGPNGWPPSQSCFMPGLVGQTPSVAWGIHTSNFLIEVKLSQLGIPASPDLVQGIRREFQKRLDGRTAYPFWVTDVEMEEICRALAQKPAGAPA